MLIFAYGSNMCTARLRARVSSARPVAVASLPGHVLRFHKRGWRDGSGKCDAFACGDPLSRVWGVVFEIEVAQKADLDRVEGLGHGYDEARREVTAADGRSWRAWLYQAEPTAIDGDAIPFGWYRDLVLAGAREHRLPGDYVRQRIVDQETRPDADRARARRHRTLLSEDLTPAR